MKKFDNYRKNLAVLSTADSQDLSNDFIIGGIIDKFFLQFELGWKMLKELLIYEGIPAAKTASPREILKEAYHFSEVRCLLPLRIRYNLLSSLPRFFSRNLSKRLNKGLCHSKECFSICL